MDWTKLSVMITGGTGSFGKEFSEIMLREYHPRKIVIFSRDETKQHEMYQGRFNHSSMRFFIGDVRNRNRLHRAMRDVDIVIHAAALKQVTACEYNPMEAVNTNIIGSKNVIDAALDTNVRKVIMLSTDKAVNPTNLYGATKLAAEKLVIQSNAYSGTDGARFSCVRYGNVLGSRGSVIPLFLKQRESGKITVTDKRMTRFWITLEQAVRFAINSVECMSGGEVFVPKIPSMRIIDLAEVIAPKCEIEYIGVRPGEKLHEVLINEDEAYRVVENENKFIIMPAKTLWKMGDYGHTREVEPGFSYSSSKNKNMLKPVELMQMLQDMVGEKRTQITTIIPFKGNLHNPQIPYGKQWIEDKDVEAVVNSLHSDWLTTGPKVAEFEEKFTKYVGTKHAIAVNNGTFALQAMLHALDIKAGDEVIVPPLTFAATANAVVFHGGVPVFADILPDTLLIDPQKVEQKITSRTRAILAVDYAGQACDYEKLKEIADKHKISLIADACHSLGGFYHGKAVGSLAAMSVFSFHPVKNITTGEGGMITTNDDKLAQKLKSYRNHGINQDFRAREKNGSWNYDMTELGANGRLTDLQSALGISQLSKIDKYIKYRHEIAEMYIEAFNNFPGIEVLKTGEDIYHAYHLFVVKVNKNECGLSRDELFSELRKRGIGVNVHYTPVHLFTFYRENYGTGSGDCPVAEAAAEEILSLPMFPLMTEKNVDFVVNNIREICKPVISENKAVD